MTMKVSSIKHALFCILQNNVCYITGDVVISDGVNVSFLNGANPQFVLTCISTGGPATTVTWTRDSATVTQGNETMLDNSTISQYNHTLTVTQGTETMLDNSTISQYNHTLTVTQGTETMLDNSTISQYTHTLTVTGRQPGLYTCTVANDKPSKDSANISIEGNWLQLILDCGVLLFTKKTENNMLKVT